MTEPTQTIPQESFEVPRTLVFIQEWMQEHGVKSIVLSFNGESDEGSVELDEIIPRKAADYEIDGRDLDEYIVKFGNEIIDSYHDGWENGEGAVGDLRIEPDSAILEFGKRREEIDNNEILDLVNSPLVPEVSVPKVAILRNWMQEHGVRSLLIGINGYADEGEIELDSIDPPEARNIEIEGQPLDDFIFFANKLVSKIHDGWENGLGGNGAIEFTADGATLDFGLREEKFDYTEVRLAPRPASTADPSP